MTIFFNIFMAAYIFYVIWYLLYTQRKRKEFKHRANELQEAAVEYRRLLQAWMEEQQERRRELETDVRIKPEPEPIPEPPPFNPKPRRKFNLQENK